MQMYLYVNYLSIYRFYFNDIAVYLQQPVIEDSLSRLVNGKLSSKGILFINFTNESVLFVRLE